jgi:hypothetical protein
MTSRASASTSGSSALPAAVSTSLRQRKLWSVALTGQGGWAGVPARQHVLPRLAAYTSQTGADAGKQSACKSLCRSLGLSLHGGLHKLTSLIVAYKRMESLSTQRHSGQKSMPKEHMCTENTDTGPSSKTPEAQDAEVKHRTTMCKQQRSIDGHKLNSREHMRHTESTNKHSETEQNKAEGTQTIMEPPQASTRSSRLQTRRNTSR